MSSTRPPLRWRGLLTGMALSAAVVTAACDNPTATAAPWSEVPLAAGLEPVVLTAAGDSLVVGVYADSPPRARLFVHRRGVTAEVPTTAHSGYAFEGRWISVASAQAGPKRSSDVVAVAGARGGAHANYRWTVWRGALPGTAQLRGSGRVEEHPQAFGVFGGWGAGDLTGVAFAGDEPVIAGAWASEQTGNDVSLWRVAGERWARQSSTGTPLGSTPTDLLGARGIATTGAGLVLTGSVTELRPGHVTSVPALWRSADGKAPWQLMRLPATDAIAEAHAARCDHTSCVVVGKDGTRLAAWEVDSTAVRRLPLPDIQLPERAALATPVTCDGHDVLVVPGRVLVRSGSAWTDLPPAPRGTPTAAAALDGRLYVISQDALPGRAHLWTRDCDPS